MTDLAKQFTVHKIAYETKPYPSLKERKILIKHLKKLLKENVKDLAEAVSKDFSIRAYEETLLLEVFPTLKAIDYCLKHIQKWMLSKKKKVSWYLKPAEPWVSPQPLGVVGIIVPWNYPIYLSIVPMIYALAAGNRVLIKFSELSTNTGKFFEALLNQSSLPVTVTTGGKKLGQEFAALPFGKLLFTGSSAVGREVMATASSELTPLILELGGKSPALISRSLNHKHLDRLFIGKCLNAGQTCIAPDYVLLPEGMVLEFEEKFANFIERHYPNISENPQYSNIISVKHRNRLETLLEDAKKKGATIRRFGEKLEQARIVPTLVLNVNADMLLLQEEIFGPIFPLMTYKSFDEALNYIRSRPNPLALYYFGSASDEISKLKQDSLSGALVINDTLTQMLVDDLPFGGVGASGFGEYHGEEGFKAFSKVKPIFIQKRLSLHSWLYPPYGRLTRYFLKYFSGIHYD